MMQYAAKVMLTLFTATEISCLPVEANELGSFRLNLMQVYSGSVFAFLTHEFYVAKLSLLSSLIRSCHQYYLLCFFPAVDDMKMQ